MAGSAVWRQLVLASLLVAVPTCRAATFACSSDPQCEDNGGICAEPGYCAFPDNACTSGFAYGEFAEPTIAGTCVEAGGTTTGSPEPASSTSDDDAGPTTLAIDEDDEDDGDGESSRGASDGVASTGSTGGGSNTTTATTGTSSGGSESGSAPQTASYPASWAGCGLTDVDPPDPATCAAQAEAGAMTVDGQLTMMATGSVGLLIVPLGSEFEGSEVLAVRLRMHVGTEGGGAASSDQTGELWMVTPFTPESVEVSLPMQVGGAPLAGDMGASVPDTDNVWALPTTVIQPKETLTLGIYPITNDGVDYFTHEGPVVPTIEVDYLP